METGQVALLFFCGLFWSAVISSTGRYRPFDTTEFFSPQKRARVCRRFLVAFFILNLLPVAGIFLLYKYVVSPESGALPIGGGAMASLSFFGLHRILHAVIASDGTYKPFYSRQEWEDVITKWSAGAANVNSFRAHMVPGVLYLLVFPLLGLLVRFFLCGGRGGEPPSPPYELWGFLP